MDSAASVIMSQHGGRPIRQVAYNIKRVSTGTRSVHSTLLSQNLVSVACCRKLPTSFVAASCLLPSASSSTLGSARRLFTPTNMSAATLKARMMIARIKGMLGGRRTTTTTTSTTGMHHAHGTHAGAKPGCFGFGKRRTGYY